MTHNSVSSHLQRFISSHVQSVEHLEILCLLAEDQSRSWSLDDTFRRIQSTKKSVLSGLEFLVARGLLVLDAQGCFRCSPESPQLRASLLQLVKLYRERRVAVIEAIYKTQANPSGVSDEPPGK